MRNRLTIDGRDGIQFLRLLCGQTNRHCFGGFHGAIVGVGFMVVNHLGTVVYRYHGIIQNEDHAMAAENPVPDKDPPEHKPFIIRIDREQYEWPEEKISGAQLRGLPPTAIPPERDLFQVVPGHTDRQIKDDDTVEVHDGIRFFTAPNTINPGAVLVSHGRVKRLS